MMTNSAIDQDAARTLAAVARLLQHAAAQVWARADAEGPRSPLHLLGLGIYTTSCEALDLVPDGIDPGPAPLEDDPRRLLVAAEELTREIPVAAEPQGFTDVVVAICDLIRVAGP